MLGSVDQLDTLDIIMLSKMSGIVIRPFDPVDKNIKRMYATQRIHGIHLYDVRPFSHIYMQRSRI